MPTLPQRRLILANGEQYVTPVEKPGSGAPPQFPRSFEEARALVIDQVNSSLDLVYALPAKKRRGDEVVLTLRLHPDATAKTYNPEAIFRMVPDLQNVGSRNYAARTSDVAATERIKKQLAKGQIETFGRLLFVRSNRGGFERLLRVLAGSQGQLPEMFQNDIRRIERFDILSAAEQLQAFRVNRDWAGGRVELVFHPTMESAEAQRSFLRQLFRGTHATHGRVVPYSDGPVFVSCVLAPADLEQLADVNALRAAHPLTFDGLDDLRSAPTFPCPPPPAAATRSTVKVGVFDGGVDPKHPYLAGYIEQDDSLSVKTPADPGCISHGTAVAGALLYGPLNSYDSATPLPAPPVSVVSVRVFPATDPKDPDLYEAIDLIEAAVPARPDVVFWNISFGPRGPIWDDTISRFTYALDNLTVSQKVGFCVAVGNDGRRTGIWSRIQSPSDLVNGIGVGAFTERKGVVMHAPYSCRGPGRECGKMKPDLVAFGGCEHTPMHLLSSTAGDARGSSGTSFASPLVASIGAQAVGTVERGTALLARTLLIHTAKHPQIDPDFLLGHGLVQTSLDGLIRCNAREVTVVFQGDISATGHVRLPIMLPLGLVVSGNVRISWTVGVLPPVKANHPSDYTSMCVEDTFYPNAQVFNFKNPDAKGKPVFKSLHLKDDAAEIASLSAKGWKRSHFPATASGNIYSTEQEKRLDYKWEPVVRRSVNKRAGSFHEPFLVLHAIPRHGVGGRVNYAAVVTISAPAFDDDLYAAVLRARPALQPIRLRTESEIRIQI